MSQGLSDFDPLFLASVEAQGFTHLRVSGVGQLCAVKRYNFTYGLVVDLQPLGHGRRYCYEHASEAVEALAGLGRERTSTRSLD